MPQAKQAPGDLLEWLEKHENAPENSAQTIVKSTPHQSPPCLRPFLDVHQSWSALELGPGPADPAAVSALYAHHCRQPAPLVHPWLVSLEGLEPPAGLPAKQQILFLSPAQWRDAGTEGTRQGLVHQGYRLGGDASSGAELEQLAKAGAQWLRLDACTAKDQISPLLLHRLEEKGLTLVATGVTSHELFSWCCNRGFALMSGEFVSRREDWPASQADPTKLRLLRLLSLTVQDADTREIEDMIKQEPKLAYNLLRLVNSVSVGACTKITTFAQAITLLGRRQLQRWLQLLIYANQFSPDNQSNPLMPQAALRGRLLELIAGKARPDGEFADSAYIAGAFSLLDVLLQIPMSGILATLPLAEPVAQALESHQGTLGQALVLVESLERGEAIDQALLQQLHLTPETLGSIQVDALAFAGHLSLE